MCRELEGKHKEYVAKRREITANVQKAQNALRELRRLLGEQERIATKLAEEYLGCATEMEIINQERRTYEALLEEVRTQISDLNKVTILVYQNGTMELENGEIPSVSDEEVTAVLVKLVSMPQVGKITVDELKTIAKLLKMVETYQTNRIPFELWFDSTEVQNFWEAVTTIE